MIYSMVKKTLTNKIYLDERILNRHLLLPQQLRKAAAEIQEHKKQRKVFRVCTSKRDIVRQLLQQKDKGVCRPGVVELIKQVEKRKPAEMLVFFVHTMYV